MESPRWLDDVVSVQQRARPSPQMKFLAATTFCLSIFALISLIASFIIILASPLGDIHGWNHYANQQIIRLAALVIASLAVSIVYLLVNCPALLSIVIDAVLAGFIIAKLNGFHGAYPDLSLCMPYRDYPYPRRPGSPVPPLIYPPPQCKDWKLALKVTMGLAAGAAIVIGLISLGLLITRLFRTRFWKRESWTLPSGTLTFTVSLKFSRLDITESGSNSGHDLIHI
ncbi:hypothetical protein CVT25_011465 [Psilocybe cyanescens]|uniref:MARVEL domain-containing protein n=1 Tax=Psilocybe cyanescens TaxID=93625 RepID=A0A409XA74_PSICY|nr:hypothetical protein CVT25_011465 [Psilocybe cyanescens]